MTQKQIIINKYVERAATIGIKTNSQKEFLANIIEDAIDAAIQDFRQRKIINTVSKNSAKISKTKGYLLDKSEYDELVKFVQKTIDEASWNSAYLDDYNFSYFYKDKPKKLQEYLNSKSENEYFKFRKTWLIMLEEWGIPQNLSEFKKYIQSIVTENQILT